MNVGIQELTCSSLNTRERSYLMGLILTFSVKYCKQAEYIFHHYIFFNVAKKDHILFPKISL